MSLHPSILVTEADIGVTVALSTSHAETGPLGFTDAVVTVTTPCFVKKGASPVATANSQYLPANIPIGIHGWKPGEQLSFLALSGTGSAYITPGA